MRKNGEWPHGHHKIRVFLEDLLTRDDFLLDIKKMRNQFGIPENGYAINPNKPKKLTSWPTSFDGNDNKKAEFINVLKYRFKKYSIGPLISATAPIRYIIFYNYIRLPEHYDLCAIEDRKYPNRSQNQYGECLYNDSTHPITIRITPEANQSDIIDFIIKNYDLKIEPLQMLYNKTKLQIGKKRSRNIKSLIISDIVAVNIDKTNSEIKAKMREQGIEKILGSSEISSLKKLEKNRRKLDKYERNK